MPAPNSRRSRSISRRAVLQRATLLAGGTSLVSWWPARSREMASRELPAAAPTTELVAGGGAGAPGRPATQVKLDAPFGSVVDRAGNLYIVEHDGQRVLKVEATGKLTLLAGDGTKGFRGDGGPAAQARFNDIHSVALADNGDLYLADTRNRRLRKIDAATGTIATIAGTGKAGYSGDGGPATKADFGEIYCASLDPAGKRLYLADLDNRRIRSVDLATGLVSLVAGTGERGVPRDGAKAVAAPLVDPRAVIADKEGNVYILERSGNALRVVDPGGRIRTVAGTGKAGYSGDSGPAIEATFNGPKHLCTDLADDVLICDTENHAVRRYSPATGRLDALVGTGQEGAAGLGGPPAKAQLSRPHGVYVHADGALYIADSGNHRVLKVTP